MDAYRLLIETANIADELVPLHHAEAEAKDAASGLDLRLVG